MCGVRLHCLWVAANPAGHPERPRCRAQPVGAIKYQIDISKLIEADDTWFAHRRSLPLPVTPGTRLVVHSMVRFRGDRPIPTQEKAYRQALGRSWLAELAANRANMNTAANPACQWLFPGGRAGQPLTPGALRQRFRALGVQPPRAVPRHSASLCSRPRPRHRLRPRLQPRNRHQPCHRGRRNLEPLPGHPRGRPEMDRSATTALSP